MDKQLVLSMFVMVFLVLFKLNLTEEIECDERCQDYALDCSSVPYTETGDTPLCDNEYYRTYCPMTCRICKRCDNTDQIDRDLADRVATLEKFLRETETSRKPRQLEIQKALSGKVLNNDSYRYGPHKLFDGNTDTVGGRYISADEDGERWVELYLSNVYQITHVFTLNALELDSGLMGTAASVCRNDTRAQKHCYPFSAINIKRPNTWLGLSPFWGDLRSSVEGNIVRIEQYNSGFLQLVEVLLFGHEINSLSSETAD